MVEKRLQVSDIVENIGRQILITLDALCLSRVQYRLPQYLQGYIPCFPDV